MKILHGLILLICTTFTLTAQTTYYVSKTGSNMNNGMSESDAFSTIQFAVDSASVGDTVLVLQGNYVEKVVFDRSGIYLGNFENDTVQILPPIDILNITGDTIISIVDQDDITVKGISFPLGIGDGTIGIHIAGNSSGTTIVNNSFSNIIGLSSEDNIFPIKVEGTDPLNLVSNLIISGNSFDGNNVGAAAELGVIGNVDGFQIRNNVIAGSQNVGVLLDSVDGLSPQNGSINNNDIAGAEGDAISINGAVGNIVIVSNNIRDAIGDAISFVGATSALVERNLILSNDGAAINVSAGDNITVRNNLISANGGPAIALGGAGPVTNSMIRNNSTYNNGLDSTQAELSISSASSTSVINNIFSNVSGRILSAASGADLVLNYNLYNTTGSPSFSYGGTSYASLEEYSAAEAQDTNSIYGDPLYQSTGQGNLNFHLTMASPAINAGDPNTVTGVDEVDAYGDLRIVDEVIDMGANEFPDVLPVTYLSPFKANLINDIVQMDWHTAEEINSDHFEVQRSTDLENWTTIVSMPSVGESHLYEAADREPLDGTTYYRLMQVDLDGTTDLSHIEIISVNKSTETRIFPNPAASWLRIEAGIGATVSEVRIFDLTGKMIMRSFDEGTNVTVDLTQLSTGTYVVQYRTNEGVKATKIQKN